MRYELTDHEGTAIRPMLPNKSCGVPRVNDRRALNGVFWVLEACGFLFTIKKYSCSENNA